jgi:hypothetical protein
MTNTLLGILTLIIGMYVLKVTYDSFANPSPVSDETHATITKAHKNVPVVDPKVVDSIKTSLKNFITERPDVITSIKLVLREPLIKKTLADILYSVRV